MRLSKVAMVVWNEFRNDARVLKEAETLQLKGHHVTVYALHTPGVTVEHETLGSGVRVIRVSRTPLLNWRKRKLPAAKVDSILAEESAPIQKTCKFNVLTQMVTIAGRLWAHLELIIQMVRSGPDVVHAHDVNTLPTAWLVAGLTRSSLVYDAHEISSSRENYTGFRTLVGCVEKYLMPRASGTITTTDTRAKFFARAYGIPRPLVLQNRPRLSVVGRTRRIRDELHLNKPWPIVLYQGGLQQGRGLERLVDAASRIEEAYFVFIGGGSLEVVLKERVRELGITARVHFIPTVSLLDLPSYTASADVGIQPIENTCLNHFSTDSNKLFEYVIAGLPVVASDLPEIRKIMRKHDLGFLVQPGNTPELIAALEKLTKYPALREQYHYKALVAAKQLNWEEQEHGLVELYEKLLAPVTVNS